MITRLRIPNVYGSYIMKQDGGVAGTGRLLPKRGLKQQLRASHGLCWASPACRRRDAHAARTSARKPLT